MNATRALALPAVLLAGLTACSRDARAPAPAAAATPTPAPDSVVAEVEGRPITLAELDARARGRLARVRQEEYEIRSQALDELIGERLLESEAQKRGVTLEDLRREEIEKKVEPPAPGVADAVYSRNRDRFSGLPRDEAIERIRELLLERAREERDVALQREIRQTSRVDVRLEPPRAAVSIPEGAPALGASDAPVTIVEFTDYQCPYCHRAQSTIEQVLSRYEGRVRFVHLDFPLDNHPGAVPAARAARCAGEQGRFWDYHRNLMTRPGPLDEADLTARAKTLELDARSFGRCLASDGHDEAIERDLRHGMELGVSGTPAYFVNGRMVSGARPLEDFAAAIDAELGG